jgi:hypothetical protein
MSYCRWSSDNFKCDLYVYEDANGGWTSHVAARRRVGLDTLPPSPYDMIGNAPAEETAAAYKAYHDALKRLPFEKLTLPHAGETFNDPDPASCAERLKYLKGLGYNVPDYAIEDLTDEALTNEALSPQVTEAKK